MKIKLFLLLSFFVVINNHAMHLNFEKYLPDYVSSITYPVNSKLITFNPTTKKQIFYLAAFHTDNFYSIERKMIERILMEERPDICILEGFPYSDGINPERIITLAHEDYAKKIGGENAFAVYHCDVLDLF